MRLFPAALAVALAGVSIATSLHGQRADSEIDPRSMMLLKQGESAAAGGNLEGATDLIETALAVDPRNRAAFLTLAGVATRQGLPGKAIRLYREALLLEPNDTAALRGQGEALIAKGAMGPARENLDRIKALCGKRPCPDAASLGAGIAKGPPPSSEAPSKVPDKPESK